MEGPTTWPGSLSEQGPTSGIDRCGAGNPGVSLWYRILRLFPGSSAISGLPHLFPATIRSHLGIHQFCPLMSSGEDAKDFCPPLKMSEPKELPMPPRGVSEILRSEAAAVDLTTLNA
jgi:hypothetical protein